MAQSRMLAQVEMLELLRRAVLGHRGGWAAAGAGVNGAAVVDGRLLVQVGDRLWVLSAKQILSIPWTDVHPFTALQTLPGRCVYRGSGDRCLQVPGHPIHSPAGF